MQADCRRIFQEFQILLYRRFQTRCSLPDRQKDCRKQAVNKTRLYLLQPEEFPRSQRKSDL